ncbi:MULTISPECIES: hypothetical protein [Vibrio]|uniref:Uncharacterized protein n=1 Tax=Vibrio vulnificus TaxID=672 RepID=A0A2S3R1F7_VIBVL|nr:MULTISPECIES: hypothetical protein [Vibrio]MCZ2801982.1 hypothetical protein [Vibrio alginolyticus]POB46933.1 hypothetical protein CRN52_12705 [Vibrio vulnificus]
MILPTPKMARLSAISLSKSIKIPETDARQVIALLFNFNSWNNLIKGLPATQPQVEPTALHSTHQFMAEKLSEMVGVDNGPAIYELIKSISPFGKKPKAYRVDIEAMQNDDNTILDFNEMREMAGMMGEGDFEENMMSFLSDMMGRSDDPAAQRLSEELKNTSLNDFQNRMRISHPIDPLTYANIFEGVLEWDMPPFEGDDIRDDNVLGEPCFTWLDQHEEEHPVFVNSLVVSPGDSKDKMFFTVLDMISEGYDEEFEKPILLFGNPVFKTIDEKRFSVIGVWNNGDGWRWLFLSKLKPWEQLSAFPDSLIDGLQNSLDDPAPPAELAEFTVNDKYPASLVYHTIAKPTEEPKFNEGGVGASFTIEERYIVGGVTGWQSYM